MKTKLTIALLLLCVSFCAQHATSQETFPPLPAAQRQLSALTESKEIKAMHAEATRLRLANGLPAIVLSEDSCQVAQNWTDHMAKTGVFAHGGGEQIIARSSESNADTIQCMAMWMGSSGHRAWLLDKASTRCGWGITRHPTRGTYWSGRFDEGGIVVPPLPPVVVPPVVVPPVKPSERPFVWWLRRIFGRR